MDGPYPGVLPFFRAALLPLLFSIASHVYTTQRPPRVVAKDASFLSVVSGASILATMAYYNSGGSFWAAWACHFLLALPWLIGAGACTAQWPALLMIGPACSNPLLCSAEENLFADTCAHLTKNCSCTVKVPEPQKRKAGCVPRDS